MKRNHYLILGGIALIGGYLWYKNDKDKKARKAALAKTLTTSSTPMTEGEASNIGGTCTCGNGFTGYCAGDCRKCCKGMDTPRKPAQYRAQTQPTRAYSSNY
jgi:hypothetical protein